MRIYSQRHKNHWLGMRGLIMLTLLAIVALALSSGVLGAPASIPPEPMPPHPDLLKRLEERGEELPPIITDPELRRAKGIDQPTTPPPKVTGTWNALAILVDFTDNPSSVGAAFFDTLLFAAPPANSMRDYYDEVSYGTFDVVTVNLPSTMGWQQAPNPYTYYTNGQYGWGAYPQNAQKLAEDAVALADPLVNFAKYDNNADGWVEALFIIHAGPGAEFTGSAWDIWSHAGAMSTPQSVDGVNAYVYSTEPEYWSAPGDMTIGIYSHEFGHVLGLPDLYDYGYDSRGVGIWSIMAFGSWNGPLGLGGSPAHPDAWSRTQLGWVTPTAITANTLGVSINTVETTPINSVYYLWNNGASNNEYFLVENRQQTGYDTYLPSNGLLIWHVDDNLTSNDNQCRDQSNCLCSTWYRVALEQADGLMNLEWDNNAGDAGDPYPGSSNNRTFNLSSTPNCGSYANCSSFVEVLNISNSGSIMTADINVLGPPVADFVGSPTSGPAPLSVNFTDLSTGQVTSWSWDFGDGGTSTAQNPSHDYTTAGTYTLSLTVSGPGGSDTESKTDYIDVTAPGSPVADFVGSPTSGPAPLSVNFTDLSTGQVTSWSWDFGDGGTSTAQNPSHTYNTPGLYTVSLTVSGPGGSDTETKPDYIQVTVGNLLINGSFENASSLPPPWKGKKLTPKDKRVCTTAYDGSCSFKMKGTKANKSLRQVVNISGSAGDSFTLSGWSKAKRPLRKGGAYCLEAKVFHTDGTKKKYKTCFTKSTHPWQYREKTFTVAKDYNKIVVYLNYKKQSGKAWFDDVRLVVQ